MNQNLTTLILGIIDFSIGFFVGWFVYRFINNKQEGEAINEPIANNE
jgi:uncharacterized membrane-anchored protein YhcB (DUF1043 family)